MKPNRASWTTFELVPLADRLRYMRLLRIGLVLVIVVIAGLNPGGIAPASVRLWPATVGYVALSGLGELFWRLWRRRGLWLFGALLVVDAAYLVYASYLTGGMSSPLRFAVLLHLVAVALLASYRTGLKLVIWYVLLFLVEYYLPAGPENVHATKGYSGVVVFAAALAAIAFGTSALSAVNERELRRRRFDLEALATLGVDLESASDSHSVAAIALASIADNFGIERLALLQLGARSELLASRGLEPCDMPVRVGSTSVASHAIQLRSTLLPAEISPDDDPFLAALFGPARNLVVTPLHAEGGGIGVLVFEHGSRRGSRIERRLLTIVERFASHTALALRNAMLLESLQRAASTDPLTGIANRRSFEEALDRELTRSCRTGEPLTLVMLDLDHFKQVNDNHGHQKGDEVLRRVAASLLENCRDMDVAARYGGEEFAVILTDCGAEEAATTAARLWAGVAAEENGLTFTVSAGYATFPDHVMSRDALVSAADKALYDAKSSGRNRIVCFTEQRRLGVVGGSA
jgi:two-component system, cell cycle response regulator